MTRRCDLIITVVNIFLRTFIMLNLTCRVPRLLRFSKTHFTLRQSALWATGKWSFRTAATQSLSTPLRKVKEELKVPTTNYHFGCRNTIERSNGLGVALL